MQPTLMEPASHSRRQQTSSCLGRYSIALIGAPKPELESTAYYETFTDRFMRAALLTSAMTPMAPAMTAALACAPDIPPRPEVTKTVPFNDSRWRYFRPAFMIVICNGHSTRFREREQHVFFSFENYRPLERDSLSFVLGVGKVDLIHSSQPRRSRQWASSVGASKPPRESAR